VSRNAAAVIIFTLTYLLISGRNRRLLPLNRPSAALLGAVLMVACGVMTRQEAYAAVDYDTIVLLLGMMIVCAYLQIGGFFDLTARAVLRRAGTARRLLAGLIATSAVLSALLVNDTVCLMMTPLVVRVMARARLPLVPYLLALAMSANIGSVATLVGNPQNMIIASMSGMTFGGFAATMIPVAVVNLAILYLVLSIAFRVELDTAVLHTASDEPEAEVDRYLLALCALVLLGIFIGFVSGANLAWTALSGAAALMVLARRDTYAILERVDWHLLLFFAALFVVVQGLALTGLPERAHDALRGLWTGAAAYRAFNFTWFSILGSNLFSNVPYVLVAGHWARGFPNPALAWKVLAMATTFAGNLTILGSVANIIVLESARGHATVDFWTYARLGIPITVVTSLVGLALLLVLPF
jgi:Na+/H+ antiporter NhaD/arsenite permease-like protein